MGVGGQSNMWTWAQDLLIWLKPYFPMVQSSSGLILVPSGLQCVGFIHHLWGGGGRGTTTSELQSYLEI